MSMNNKVLVGISGGVDSAVAALRLMNMGYEVSGAVFQMSPLHRQSVKDAEVCCEKLGIPLYVKNLTEEFEHHVIGDFCRRYSCGVTPNPCVICNPLVKFRALAQTADEIGAHFIATGHYAKVKHINGIPVIAKAASLQRDQSYMLYRLPEDIIGRLIFPLELAEKDDVRSEARNVSLSNADAPDSQEICFIEGKDYASFIHSKGYFGKTGSFILPDGRKIPHRGVEYYTVGQRKGLGISYSQPLFVREICDNGHIVLSISGGEYSAAISVSDPVFSRAYDPSHSLTVKVRSMAKNAPCTLHRESDRLIALFSEPLRAPAPGQSAVFYDGDIVVGGGFIDHSFVENPLIMC